MLPDAPSHQLSEPSSQEGAFNPQASLSRRAFLKASLAFLGLFSLSRYFTASARSRSGLQVSTVVPSSQALPDARTVAYTSHNPLQKTNA